MLFCITRYYSGINIGNGLTLLSLAWEDTPVNKQSGFRSGLVMDVSMMNFAKELK